MLAAPCVKQVRGGLNFQEREGSNYRLSVSEQPQQSVDRQVK